MRSKELHFHHQFATAININPGTNYRGRFGLSISTATYGEKIAEDTYLTPDIFQSVKPGDFIASATLSPLTGAYIFAPNSERVEFEEPQVIGGLALRPASEDWLEVIKRYAALRVEDFFVNDYRRENGEYIELHEHFKYLAQAALLATALRPFKDTMTFVTDGKCSYRGQLLLHNLGLSTRSVETGYQNRGAKFVAPVRNWANNLCLSNLSGFTIRDSKKMYGPPSLLSKLEGLI